MIIMPSTPRLRTPERSATSSPERRKQQRRRGRDDREDDGLKHVPSARPWLRSGDEADAIEDQRIAGEHEEQQNALEHAGQVERQPERDLRLLAADEGERQEQPGDQNADRIEPAEKRDDDRGEAVAGRNAGLQLADRTRDLDDAGEAGKRRRRSGTRAAPACRH